MDRPQLVQEMRTDSKGESLAVLKNEYSLGEVEWGVLAVLLQKGVGGAVDVEVGDHR